MKTSKMFFLFFVALSLNISCSAQTDKNNETAKVKQGDNVEVYYFHSYELMMDDLREYRFYAEDMVHPSQLAVDYIWEKFLTACINSKTFTTLQEIKKIKTALNHRPFQPETTTYKDFLNKNLIKIEKLKLQFPEMGFLDEIQTINNQINS